MRKTILIGLLIVATLLCVACGGGGEATPTDSDVSSAPPDDPVVTMTLKQRLNTACKGMHLGVTVEITPDNLEGNSYARQIFNRDASCFSDFFIRLNFMSDQSEVFVLAIPKPGQEQLAIETVEASAGPIEEMLSALAMKRPPTATDYETQTLEDGLVVLIVSPERATVIKNLIDGPPPEPEPDPDSTSDASSTADTADKDE